MKKSIGIVGGIVWCLLSVSAKAQQTWDAKKNPAVEAITTQYQGKYIAPRPALTTADIFPVIGQYESAINADAASVTITLDGANKGLVWIEGLPQGKIKAMLRKSPAIYKIPTQKTEDGKDVAEGTLIFNKETNTLSICIGKMYNAEDPVAVFTTATEDPATSTVKTSKTKKQVLLNVWIYTGAKRTTETVSN